MNTKVKEKTATVKSKNIDNTVAKPVEHDLATHIKKTQLTKIVLDDKDIVKAYNGPVRFYVNVPLDISYYVASGMAGQEDDLTKKMTIMILAAQDIMLDSEGNQIFGHGLAADSTLVMAAVGHIAKLMGNE